MKILIKIILSPQCWLGFSLVYLFWYTMRAKTKKQRLAFLNVKGVFRNYKKVFPVLRDFLFFLILPFLLAVATQLNQRLNNAISNIICVVLSILESTVLTFMAMSNEKYQSIKEDKNLTLGDLRAKFQNEDTIAIGMYETLVSVIVLILNFLFPVIKNYKIVAWIVSLLIYWGFYIFVINIIIIVRRLYQIYFPNNFQK